MRYPQTLRSRRARLVFVAVGVTVAACDTMARKEPGTDKGTNDDASTDSGAETGVDTSTATAPDQDAVVDNPNIKLSKVYWALHRNAAAGEDRCYFLPRPDAVPAALEECEREGPLASTLRVHDLCATSPDPDTINRIPCDTALEISTFLHEHLVFTAVGPYSSDADKAAACAHPSCAAATTTVLGTFCPYYTQRAQSAANGEPVPAIARLDTEAELAAIAACLNELYGIEMVADPNAAHCTGTPPDPTYRCVEDCGPPVATAGVTPTWSWISAADAANRQSFGCPICLAPETLLATPNGDIPVRRLRAGDAILTVDRDGKTVPSTVLVATSTPTQSDHALIRVTLADGRAVSASPGHPLVDGRLIGTLTVGDAVAGSTVVGLKPVPWGEKRTFDVLPGGATGAYIANGIPLGSTLGHSPEAPLISAGPGSPQ